MKLATTGRLSILVAFIAAGILATTSARTETPTIKIGYLAQAHDGPLMNVETALGPSYKFEYVKFLRYADAEIALANGDIQVASLGYVSAISAASRGGDPKFKFVAGQSRGAINLVCRDDVRIGGWADLKGHTYGVLTGGPAEIFFDQALAQHGVKQSDIQKLTFAVPGPPLLQALKEKAIDCTAVYEPFAASAVADGLAVYPPIDLAENPFAGINGGIAVNIELLKSDPSLVRRIVDASVKAVEEFPKNKPGWIATVVAKTGFPVKTVTLAVDHVILDWHLYPDRVAVLANAVAALGTIKRPPSNDALTQYFDLSFIATGRQ
jgi:ABC-type nitrate/sulfonate/bicarbonate transport system substrate-binding protein